MLIVRENGFEGAYKSIKDATVQYYESWAEVVRTCYRTGFAPTYVYFTKATPETLSLMQSERYNLKKAFAEKIVTTEMESEIHVWESQPDEARKSLSTFTLPKQDIISKWKIEFLDPK